MTEYTPDCWTVIYLDGPDPHYRVLAGWSGGYLHGDSWKLNSGIVRVEEENEHLRFYGASGSVYCCHKDRYGIRNSTAGTWNKLKQLHSDAVTLLDETTDWKTQDWILT